MGHSLVLEMPAEIYDPLAQKAQAQGRAIEPLAVELLAQATRQTDDPVEQFIGVLSEQNAPPDWSDNHDLYLSRALQSEFSEPDSQP